jgi:hypothetical protein
MFYKDFVVQHQQMTENVSHVNSKQKMGPERNEDLTAEEAMDSKWVIGSPTYFTVRL